MFKCLKCKKLFNRVEFLLHKTGPCYQQEESDSGEYTDDFDADPSYSPQRLEESEADSDNECSASSVTSEELRVAEEVKGLLLNGNIPFGDIFESWEDDSEVTGEAVSKKNIKELIHVPNDDNINGKGLDDFQTTSNSENPAAQAYEEHDTFEYYSEVTGEAMSTTNVNEVMESPNDDNSTGKCLDYCQTTSNSENPAAQAYEEHDTFEYYSEVTGEAMSTTNVNEVMESPNDDNSTGKCLDYCQTTSNSENPATQAYEEHDTFEYYSEVTGEAMSTTNVNEVMESPNDDNSTGKCLDYCQTTSNSENPAAQAYEEHDTFEYYSEVTGEAMSTTNVNEVMESPNDDNSTGKCLDYCQTTSNSENPAAQAYEPHDTFEYYSEITLEAMSTTNVNEVMESPNDDNSTGKCLDYCQTTSNSENPAAEPYEPHENWENDSELTGKTVSKKSLNEVMDVPNYDNIIEKGLYDCQTTSNNEDPVAEPDEPPQLLVGKSKLKPKRLWDKRDCCIFCLNLVTNFTRHIIRNHEDESEVGKILANPKGSKERRLLFEQLRKKGNFFHNKKCLREKTGSIIVTQRPATSNPVEKYLPCKMCLGFYAQESLYRHMQKCKLKTPTDSSKNARSFGAMLLVVTPDGFASLKEKVFPIMRHDEITKAAQEDSLICEFGARLLQYQKDHHMKTVISQKMRELARLKLEMKAKITGNHDKYQSFNQLEDFLHPDLYKQIVSCVHSIAGYDEETGRFKIPSLAKKLGYSLQTCAELMECKGLMLSNEELRKRGENFSKLLQKMWKSDVSMNASKTLSMDSWNKPKMLPLAEDIKRLHDFLVTKEQNLFVQLSQDPSELVWRELAEISLVRIILLNRRRSGEAQRIKLSQYNTINNQPIHSDTTELLSDVERNLCQSFSRFHIQGKASGRTGRPVTVLLTNDMRKSIDLLIATREKCNINKENPYLFAIAKTAHSCIRGSDVLRKYAKLVKAKLPGSIKSINLRKQVATMSQLLNLTENDIESLATFMGHSVNVHKEYYRLPDDVLQMAKISKLLLALEAGKIKELKGLNFDNISVSDCESEEDPEELNSESCLNHKPKQSTSMTTKENVPLPLDDINIIPESSSAPVNHSVTNEPSDTISKSITKIAQKKRRATCVKRPWNEKEKEALVKHFQKHMICKKVPNKEECMKCIKEEDCLRERSWPHVKFQVKNMFNKI